MPASPGWKNKLFYGENLEILRERISSESVDLCYIDPPFNSNRNFNQIYSSAKRKDSAQAQAFLDTWTWDIPAEDAYQEVTTNVGGRFNRETIELFIGLRAVLKMLMAIAYNVREENISGGPNWIATDRWNIEAKAEEGSMPPGGWPKWLE